MTIHTQKVNRKLHTDGEMPEPAGNGKADGVIESSKVSDMVRKARISRKLKRGKKQAQEAGKREGGACIDCLLAWSGRKKSRFMLASSTVS
jgi:hypothetical protein